MKHQAFYALAAAVLFPFAALADGGPVFTDASAFPVFGKCIEETSARYERLPSSLKGVTRDPVWDLGRNSSGLYIRFRTNSTAIHVRWKSTDPLHHMPHMTDAGDNGLDLYLLTGEGWRFAGSAFQWARPGEDGVREKRLIANMEPEMRECMLYLSLYDGIDRLEIGVDEGAVLEGPAVDSPRAGRPVVMYGSSIMQGCSASRPGMAFTAIIGRRLDCEVVNLGFSGNGQLDLEIARYMASVKDPAVFVLDHVPNSTPAQIEERGEKFFNILREAHPGVPVIFVEDPTFPHTRWDLKVRSEVEGKNAAQRALFEKLKKAGVKDIYYVPTDRLIGTDGEATVDGTHFTDIGMVRYSDILTPVIKKAVRKSR